MRTLRSASVDDFIEWYLRRELTKANIRSVGQTRFERQTQMEATQPGKLWPGYISWSWSLVEISPSELPNLLILSSGWTREEQLVRNHILRTLDAAVTHALESGYFTTQADRRTRHQSYYSTYERSTPSTSELDRIVLRTLRDDERSEVVAAGRGDVSYYLHDGFGRCLPYLTLLRQKRVEPVVIEAYLANAA